jgi:hypothetical protein
MAKNLLFGHYAISKNNLWDLGNDPFYHKKPFSWGICRPKNRIYIDKGTRIFFHNFKDKIGDYFLTGMMKVDRIYTQIEAANSELHCGKKIDTCTFKIKPTGSLKCPSRDAIEYNEKVNKGIIIRRNCRCNIVVDNEGNYKSFCDGFNHIHIYLKYLNSKIYFVSTNEHSIATKNKIRILNFIAEDTKFWNYSRFYGYEIDDELANKFEKELKQNQYKIK